MAAANESQGLKIAVAVFVTLTVILAVTTYFAFSNYDQAAAQKAAADSEAQKSQTAAASAIRDFKDLNKTAGFDKFEEYAQVKDAVKKFQDGQQKKLTEINAKIKEMLDQYKAAGGNNQKIDELGQALDQLNNQITNEPNKTFASSLDRMLELTGNATSLVTALTLDNEDLRKQLADVNKVNASQIAVTNEQFQKSKTDLNTEHTKHETDRQALLTKVDQLQTEVASKATEIAKLNGQIEQTKTDNTKTVNELLVSLRSLREQLDKTAIVMDKPDGRITYVDNVRGEVRTTLTRRDGVHEQMTFAVFDRNSPGLPTDRPKATIELIRVTDRDSIGRIVKTEQTHEPIRYNDFVYSPSFDKSTPKRYALIGKIDMDRDGRDDREDLKRLIRATGGVIDYDLPPSAVGRETGKLSPLTDWYVLDDLKPLRGEGGKNGRSPGDDDSAFLAKRTEAIRTARLEGIRPISIERLLPMIGYQFGVRAPGRVEAINREATDAMTNPRGRVAPPAGETTPPAEGAETPDASKPDETAKPDDAAKAEDKPEADAGAAPMPK